MVEEEEGLLEILGQGEVEGRSSSSEKIGHIKVGPVRVSVMKVACMQNQRVSELEILSAFTSTIDVQKPILYQQLCNPLKYDRIELRVSDY